MQSSYQHQSPHAQRGDEKDLQQKQLFFCRIEQKKSQDKKWLPEIRTEVALLFWIL